MISLQMILYSQVQLQDRARRVRADELEALPRREAALDRGGLLDARRAVGAVRGRLLGVIRGELP